MTDTVWSQDFFGKGELSPLMYSRITTNAYYQALKKAKNVISLPQGSAGKRFGTKYLNEVTGITNFKDVYFKSFQYLDECTYLLVFKPNIIDIYLEGRLVFTVPSTNLFGSDMPLLDYTVLVNRFVVTSGSLAPKNLIREANSAQNLTAFTATTLTTGATSIGIDVVLPVRFIATLTVPTTSPRIREGITYFGKGVTNTSTFELYATAQDAAAGINKYTIIDLGTGTNSVTFLNTWTFPNYVFKNQPQFDFNKGYNASTFTLSALSGNGVTLTIAPATATIFSTDYIGGTYTDYIGTARIVGFISATQVTVNIIEPFTSLGPTIGTDVLVTEPAWSNKRGWPRKCSSFQNRAFFANSDSLTNGLWGSVINDYNDFNDLIVSDDGAISWFPTSDTVSYIQWIVPYRSLTIHTNSGVFSTPLSVETAITQKNFSLSMQDSTAADSVQPRNIDNQVIVLSGNDAHSLLWDGFNNAYTSSIISIINEQLIRNPQDEAEYVDKTRAGSRYMFIVNGDGSLAIYQTLVTEDISGFTPAVLEQSYGKAYFRWVTSNFDGRAWFFTERELGAAKTQQIIFDYTTTWLEVQISLTTDFNPILPTAIRFVSGTLPACSTPLTVNTIYWATLITPVTFALYATQEDAINGINNFTFTSDGSGAIIEPYKLETKYFIEELSFDSYVDCAGLYNDPNNPTASIAGQTRFNAQDIVMNGDGYGFSDTVSNGLVEFKAHGVDTPVSIAQYGFPIHLEIVPLPLSIPIGGTPRSANLVDTKHIRYITLLFADTVGGQITQFGRTFPIVMKNLIATPPGVPPAPQTGSFEMSSFAGWDDFNYQTLSITHSEPFPIRLTGLFYKVDV